MNFKYVSCPKCNRFLDFADNIKNTKGTGVVYTCICGHKTGVKVPKKDA